MISPRPASDMQVRGDGEVKVWSQTQQKTHREFEEKRSGEELKERRKNQYNNSDPIADHLNPWPSW